MSEKKKRRQRSDKLVIHKDQIPQIKRLAGLGLGIGGICQILGMSTHTFERRRHENPELAEAVEKGKAEANTKVAQSLYEQATEGKNTAAAIFWLKARAGWTDRDRELEEKLAKINSLSSKELEDKAMEALEKRGYKIIKPQTIEVESDPEEDSE